MLTYPEPEKASSYDESSDRLASAPVGEDGSLSSAGVMMKSGIRLLSKPFIENSSRKSSGKV